jgi:hypothetical protein
LRAASISAGVTAAGDIAAALSGCANSTPAIDAVEIFSSFRLDHFRSCTASSLYVRGR